MLFILSLLAFVLTLLFSYFLGSPSHRYYRDSQVSEFIWTALPMLILICMALPSLRLLYLLDEVGLCGSTSFLTSSQWYWSYESSDSGQPFHSSFLIPYPIRLLGSDSSLALHSGLCSRLLLTSSDVLHSFSLPCFGLKADCVPGRLNSLVTVLDRPGLFWGQCSEICGSNHSFMPISCEVLPLPTRVTFR